MGRWLLGGGGNDQEGGDLKSVNHEVVMINRWQGLASVDLGGGNDMEQEW